MSNSSKDLDRLRGKLVVDGQTAFKPPKKEPTRIVNKIHNNLHLVKKAVLFDNLVGYYKMTGENADDNIPLTFTIKDGINDLGFNSFKQFFNRNIEHKKPNIWIIKPGEDTNRGNGIQVLRSLQSI
jgi:tubulin--tyrosine ligase